MSLKIIKHVIKMNIASLPYSEEYDKSQKYLKLILYSTCDTVCQTVDQKLVSQAYLRLNSHLLAEHQFRK